MLSLKPWRAEAVFFFIGAQISCLIFGGATAALLHKAGVPGFRADSDFGTIFLATFCFQGATCFLMWIFFRIHDVDWRDVFGFRKPTLLRSLLLSLCTVIYVLPVALELQQASLVLMEKIHWMPQNEAAVELMTEAGSIASKVYLGFFAVVLVPVAEEFIFRGVLYPFIKQLGFPKTAWIGVNLFFALIHADAGIFISLFFLALTLTWLYEVTDSLIAPIFAHALFNAANLVVLIKSQT